MLIHRIVDKHGYNHDLFNARLAVRRNDADPFATVTVETRKFASAVTPAICGVSHRRGAPSSTEPAFSGSWS